MLARLQARLAVWRRAVTALRTDGRTVLGVAARLRAKDGRAFGAYLRQKLPRRFVRGAGAEMVADAILNVEFERRGIVWRVDLGDVIGHGLFVTGRYEGAEVDAVLAWVGRHRSQRLVVDLGANVGTTAIPFAIGGYRVLAVEPVPATFAMLTANVANNGLEERIHCVQRAIADADGGVEMWTGFASGQAEIAVAGREPGMTRWGARGALVTVPSSRLDVLLRERLVDIGDLALVWADVQGSETAVIETGADLWEHGVPLYAEINRRFLELQGGQHRFLLAATTHFSSFIPGDVILAGGAPRSITELTDFVTSIDFGRDVNALLLP